MTISSERVARNFSRSAEIYDSTADLQRRAAERLMTAFNSDSPQTKPKKILEIGCGTGFVTDHLLRRFPEASVLVCDISEAMLARCRRNVSSSLATRSASVEFTLADADADIPAGDFDLVISGLTFQWFTNLSKTLGVIKERLNIGGRLVFSTMGNQTFAEIRHFFKQADALFPAPPLLSTNEAKRACSIFPKVTMSEFIDYQRHASLRDFLRHLRETGAVNATESPLTTGTLRRVIREWDDAKSNDSQVNAAYHVIQASCQKTL